jgi:hypothetical protein
VGLALATVSAGFSIVGLTSVFVGATFRERPWTQPCRSSRTTAVMAVVSAVASPWPQYRPADQDHTTDQPLRPPR